MLILPCIMIQCNKNGLIIVSIYVDGNFCVGHKKACDGSWWEDLMNAMKNGTCEVEQLLLGLDLC